ncbi:hypothetical protein GCM10010185_48880 [Saccharothrix coeruleofusca]|uniref:Uncharacterized protein n=1 Tax=Saccharothrix coeruleofusca TaxID=33919 RepID=A0A918AQE8_9PSEU|nr:hypothetical protein [Saccharothrix coeruleofusca]GGP70096.1 hypothetical protein GCM10010185_48880 [Saccharothrix coeruleofusca]
MPEKLGTPEATARSEERQRFLRCAVAVTRSRQVSWSVLATPASRTSKYRESNPQNA